MPTAIDGTLYGDAPGTLSKHQKAGAQTFDASGFDTAIGDVDTLLDHARGGADTIAANESVPGLRFLGDAVDIRDHARGGNDTISGSHSFLMYGDAEVLADHGRGGNDHLFAYAAGPL